MSPDPQSPLLEVRNVVKSFGGFRALDGISFALGRGEILGLVGPNGSGKTTCINLISGLFAPNEGQVLLRGRPVGGLPLHRMAHLGVNRTFQVPRPFKTLTVLENVAIAKTYARQGHTHVEDPLEFTGLSHLKDRDAGSLNSAQQKMLDLARALTTGPDLLLIDELAAGLSAAEMEEVATRLHKLVEYGISLVVVEHHLAFVNRLTQRVIVMNAGKAIFEGNLETASRDPVVVEVYLGA